MRTNLIPDLFHNQKGSLHVITDDNFDFQIRLKFFNRSSCSIVGTDFLGQFFTSSGHSDWPTDIHSPRQRYNLIYRLPQLQRWLRGEKITSFTAPTKIKKQLEERFKLSNEHIMPCGQCFVNTSRWGTTCLSTNTC